MCIKWPKSKGVMTCEDRCETTNRILSLGDDDKVNCDKRESRPKDWFTAERVSVELIADTGSKYTNIPEDVFMKNWLQLELMATDICSGGYQGEEIEILGFFSTVISFKTRETFGKVYVAESRPPILGWMHQYDLNIIVNSRGTEQILIVDDVDVNVILEQPEAELSFTQRLGNNRREPGVGSGVMNMGSAEPPGWEESDDPPPAPSTDSEDPQERLKARRMRVAERQEAKRR
ncbi:hypothetical protein NDU88_011020 [Pleurodeles waltl]|uniref:Peptidase A2 domain-containing protein n=1 Tax=Pleurodeles waltl TaxID=8319 RepID=A0AAV7S467_PLEWA|nr:hypothetical protein NDU88_011020 [Pleurodeles waltl]